MNNIADISAFENLQNQANASMGYQPMSANSVFNDNIDSKDKLVSIDAKVQVAEGALLASVEALKKGFKSFNDVVVQAKKMRLDAYDKFVKVDDYDKAQKNLLQVRKTVAGHIKDTTDTQMKKELTKCLTDIDNAIHQAANVMSTLYEMANRGKLQ